MKVSLIHPERRTLQSIALEGAGVPKKLRQTHRRELTLKPGDTFEFIAGIGGSAKLGPVPLVVELVIESGDLMREGWLTYRREFADTPASDMTVLPTRDQIIRAIDLGDALIWSFSIELTPKSAVWFAITNHALIASSSEDVPGG